MKAIETPYKGYRMRSRLEARWAIFFDTLGVQFEYEAEGFDLGDAGWYLPDFWLETVHMWAEIKRSAFSDKERERCKALVRATGFPCLMLDGTPTDQTYFGYEPGEWFDDPETFRTGPDAPVFETDYVLIEPHNYPHTEHRFYACTGNAPGDRRTGWINDIPSAPVLAARRARFEHGEAA